MKFIMKYVLKNSNSLKIDLKQIETSNRILFAVFSRYGDALISFQIINEFISKYRDKKFLILTTKQHYVYAKEIFGDKAEIRGVNKRNPIDFFGTIYYLKKFKADLGFNPWSHGDESKFFITFSKNYFFYRDFDNFDKIFNLYDRIRLYLLLDVKKEKKVLDFELNSVEDIVFAPFSSDITKNLSLKNIEYVLSQFTDKRIVLALPEDINIKNYSNVKKFFFSKKNSDEFLEYMKSCDLFIGVDSGPLHIAIALKISFIAFFGPTAPETILNNLQYGKIVRLNRLKGKFCFYKECKNPICIDELSFENIYKHYNFEEKLELIMNRCALEDEV